MKIHTRPSDQLLKASAFALLVGATLLLLGTKSFAQQSCPPADTVRERSESATTIVIEQCVCRGSAPFQQCKWEWRSTRYVTPPPPPTPTRLPNCQYILQADQSTLVRCQYSMRVRVGTDKFGRAIYQTQYYWQDIGVTPGPPTPTSRPVYTPTPPSASAGKSTPSPASTDGSGQQGTVAVSLLNLRSGPGQDYPIVGQLPLGTFVTIMEQRGDWYRVRSVQGDGWVAARMVTPSSQTSSNSRSSASAGLLTDLEVWGRWARGDEPWGTFAQSSERQVSGRFAGKLAYEFPADPKNYVVFRRVLPINGRPSALRLQVYGDDSTHFLNAWIQDANGQLWQFTFGRINHSSWQTMLAPFDLSLGWPNQAVGTAKTSAPVYPLRFYAFVLDGYASDRTFQGSIYLDDLEAVGP